MWKCEVAMEAALDKFLWSSTSYSLRNTNRYVRKQQMA